MLPSTVAVLRALAAPGSIASLERIPTARRPFGSPRGSEGRSVKALELGGDAIAEVRLSSHTPERRTIMEQHGNRQVGSESSRRIRREGMGSRGRARRRPDLEPLESRRLLTGISDQFALSVNSN